MFVDWGSLQYQQYNWAKRSALAASFNENALAYSILQEKDVPLFYGTW